MRFYRGTRHVRRCLRDQESLIARAHDRPLEADLFARPNTPFIPVGDSLFSRIEPGAVGSMLVLVALIGAIGFGGCTVLQEVQRVQVAPVDQTPVVLSDLDPLAGRVDRNA